MYFDYEKKQYPFTFSVGKGLSPTPHLHSHIELVLMTAGTTIATADDKTVTVTKDDVFISFSNQIHYYHDVDKVRHSIIIFSPDLLPELSMVLRSALPASPLVKGAGKNPVIKHFMDEFIRLTDSKSDYYDIETKGYLLILMCELLKMMKIDKTSHYGNDAVKDVIRYCYENYSSQICLDNIAEELHINKFYISHIFSQKLKISFNDYINHLRVHKACELLKNKKLSITEISFAVGYSSTRSFNRCFKNIKNSTPKEYRARHTLPIQI